MSDKSNYSSSSSESEAEVLETSKIKNIKKNKFLLSILFFSFSFFHFYFSDACKEDIKNISNSNGDVKNIDELKISKFSLQIITKKLKKAIKGNEVERIKKKILIFFKHINQN